MARWDASSDFRLSLNSPFILVGGVSPLIRSLEVLEVDILWPRWVARIGVTRATEACFLAADRQCTELPLLRLPRLVPEVVGCDPFVPRDLARVGWRGLAPFLPIGPRERPRLADSFSRLGQARGASPGSLDQRSEEWPLCEGKSGALGVRASSGPLRGGKGIAESPRAPQFGTPEMPSAITSVIIDVQLQSASVAPQAPDPAAEVSAGAPDPRPGNRSSA